MLPMAFQWSPNSAVNFRTCSGSPAGNPGALEDETMTSTPKLTSHEIIAAYYRLGDLMDEGGDPTTTSERQEEIDEEAIELFERLGDEAPDKLEALRSVAIHAEGEARMLRDEERRLAQRRRGREKLVTRLKGYAGQVLAARRLAGQEPKIKTASHTFWLQSSTSLTNYRPGRSKDGSRRRSSPTGRRQERRSSLVKRPRGSSWWRMSRSAGDEWCREKTNSPLAYVFNVYTIKTVGEHGAPAEDETSGAEGDSHEQAEAAKLERLLHCQHHLPGMRAH